jgi:hypothetical protein
MTGDADPDRRATRGESADPAILRGHWRTMNGDDRVLLEAKFDVVFAPLVGSRPPRNSFKQDLLRRPALREFVDELVEVADLCMSGSSMASTRTP